jgi:Ca2+-binding EF-hand superfamily protein
MIEEELSALLASEIDFQLKLEQLKQDIWKLEAFSVKRVFKAVDQLNNKFVDEQALRRYLKMVGHQPLKEELVAIMRRFDLDGDARLTFLEFAEALTPV